MSQRKTIDARGAFCPGPLMELIAALKLVEIGDEIEVLSTDKEQDGQWSIVVRKAK
jgi:tRNA 2-thiouridine synthesizing protein A